MINIRAATDTDLQIISTLAHEIWFPTYGNYLSEEQIIFMLKHIYSEDALSEQIKAGHRFILIDENTFPKGFASFSATEEKDIFKIHKIYLHPDLQGKGAGKLTINYITDDILKAGGKILELNVNRNNPAKSFYEKMGFLVVKSVDIPYYQFVLNDFVMRKSVG